MKPACLLLTIGWVWNESVTLAEDTGFNAKISQCIENALDSLGEGVKQSFYLQIQEKYNLPREQFGHRPAEVIEHLEKVLGTTGSLFIERLIIREIRKSFGLKETSKQPLEIVIQDARSKFLDVADRDFE